MLEAISHLDTMIDLRQSQTLQVSLISKQKMRTAATMMTIVAMEVAVSILRSISITTEVPTAIARDNTSLLNRGTWCL